MECSRSLRQALTGFVRAIPHLDGHKVDIVVSTVTSHGTIQIVAGEGMPKKHDPTSHGDLYIEYKVKFPKSITAEQAKGIVILM